MQRSGPITCKNRVKRGVFTSSTYSTYIGKSPMLATRNDKPRRLRRTVRNKRYSKKKATKEVNLASRGPKLNERGLVRIVPWIYHPTSMCVLPGPNGEIGKREITVTVQMEDGLQPEPIESITFSPETTSISLPAEQPIGIQGVSITEMTAGEITNYKADIMVS